MERFQVIDDAAVITLTKGVYRQAKLYRRGNKLYAAYGTGFVRLFKGGSTGLPNLSWHDIDPADGTLGEESLGLTYHPALAVAAE